MSSQMQKGIQLADGVELCVYGWTFRALAHPSVIDNERVIVRVSQINCDPSSALHQGGDVCTRGLSTPQIRDAIAAAALAIAKQLVETIKKQARAASKPSAPEKPRRDPRNGWGARSGSPGWPCDTCTANANYCRPETLSGACEACAERAGVFGPVSDSESRTASAVGNGPPMPVEEMGGAAATPISGRRTTDTVTLPKPGTCLGESRSRDGGERPAPITCAGPLATHGTPVLRVMGGAPDRCSGHLAPHGPPLLRVMGAEGDVYQLWICDKCYLNHEKNIATAGLTPLHKKDLGAVQQPPARLGTVPQSIGRGAGIGIWASRGMR